eukprot:g4285.t1
MEVLQDSGVVGVPDLEQLGGEEVGVNHLPAPQAFRSPFHVLECPPSRGFLRELRRAASSRVSVNDLSISSAVVAGSPDLASRLLLDKCNPFVSWEQRNGRRVTIENVLAEWPPTPRKEGFGALEAAKRKWKQRENHASNGEAVVVDGRGWEHAFPKASVVLGAVTVGTGVAAVAAIGGPVPTSFAGIGKKVLQKVWKDMKEWRMAKNGRDLHVAKGDLSRRLEDLMRSLTKLQDKRFELAKSDEVFQYNLVANTRMLSILLQKQVQDMKACLNFEGGAGQGHGFGDMEDTERRDDQMRTMATELLDWQAHLQILRIINDPENVMAVDEHAVQALVIAGNPAHRHRKGRFLIRWVIQPHTLVEFPNDMLGWHRDLAYKAPKQPPTACGRDVCPPRQLIAPAGTLAFNNVLQGQENLSGSFCELAGAEICCQFDDNSIAEECLGNPIMASYQACAMAEEGCALDDMPCYGNAEATTTPVMSSSPTSLPPSPSPALGAQEGGGSNNVAGGFCEVTGGEICCQFDDNPTAEECLGNPITGSYQARVMAEEGCLLDDMPCYGNSEATTTPGDAVCETCLDSLLDTSWSDCRDRYPDLYEPLGGENGLSGSFCELAGAEICCQFDDTVSAAECLENSALAHYYECQMVDEGCLLDDMPCYGDLATTTPAMSADPATDLPVGILSPPSTTPPPAIETPAPEDTTSGRVTTTPGPAISAVGSSSAGGPGALT